MAVVSRIARVSAGTGPRVITATAATQDIVAGGSVTITVTQSGGNDPTSLQLSMRVDNSDTVIRNYGLNLSSASQTVTFYMTHDGTATGTPCLGTVRLRIQATRSGQVLDNYSVNSDTTVGSDQGWIRGTGSVTATTIQRDDMTTQSPYAYPDVLSATTTLSAPFFVSRTAGVAVSGPQAFLARHDFGDGRIPSALTFDAPGAFVTDEAPEGFTKSLRLRDLPDATVAQGDVTTWVETTLTYVGAGTIEFWMRRDMEVQYDYPLFEIDGVMVEWWENNEGWIHRSYPVAAGEHTFRWTVSKDHEFTEGEDAFWVTGIMAKYDDESLHTGTGQVTGTSGTGTDTFTGLISISNAFKKALATYTVAFAAPDADLTGLPVTVATEAAPPSIDVNPVLATTPLLQVNNPEFGTPPASRSHFMRRLATQLGFLATRFVNARGEGVNGLTYTGRIWDQAELLGDAANPVTSRTTTTVTQGGEDGWSQRFVVWDNMMPGGNWVSSREITAPNSALGLEANEVATLVLVAGNPDIRLIVGAGPATGSTDSRHISPGVPVLVGMIAFDTALSVTVPLDIDPVPSIAIGRFNVSMGRAEYLDSDGTWKPATGATDMYYWPCAVSPGDPHTWIRSFADTSTWGVSDLFTVAKGSVDGAPMTAFMKEPVVSGINNHDGYKFDGPGFLGFPTR